MAAPGVVSWPDREVLCRAGRPCRRSTLGGQGGEVRQAWAEAVLGLVMAATARRTLRITTQQGPGRFRRRA